MSKGQKKKESLLPLLGILKEMNRVLLRDGEIIDKEEIELKTKLYCRGCAVAMQFKTSL